MLLRFYCQVSCSTFSKFALFVRGVNHVCHGGTAVSYFFRSSNTPKCHKSFITTHFILLWCGEVTHVVVAVPKDEGLVKAHGFGICLDLITEGVDGLAWNCYKESVDTIDCDTSRSELGYGFDPIGAQMKIIMAVKEFLFFNKKGIDYIWC